MTVPGIRRKTCAMVPRRARMSRAPYKPRPKGTLKQATAQLIAACGGDTLAAEGLRVSRGTLFKYSDADGENASRFMPADIVRTLEDRCGEPVVTTFLAHAAGYVLKPLDTDAVSGLAEQVSRTAREVADVFAETSSALADGTVSPGEAGRIVAEVDEALARMSDLRAAAERLMSEEG